MPAAFLPSCRRLAALLLILVLSLPLTAHCQQNPALQNFVFYQLPNRRPVAHSTLDQGELVQSRLRMRRAAPPLQTAGGFQSRVRPSRDEEEERAGGPLYECTSLDGPECSFARGEQQVSPVVIKLLQNLVARAVKDHEEEEERLAQQEEEEEEEAQQAASVSVVDSSTSVSTAPDDATSAHANHADDVAAAAQHNEDGQLTVSDDDSAAAATDAADEAEWTDEERAYYEELSSLSLSQLILRRAIERDGEEAVEGDMGGLVDEDGEFEYELLTVGEDGLEREMNEEEREELRQQLLHGEVDVDFSDEAEEGEGEEGEEYWEDEGLEFNTTSGEYEYGEDEQLVANGVH